MEGVLRFHQDKDDWFIEYEEFFRIVKDEKGQAYEAETIIKNVKVEPYSAPGKYPTDILLHDGEKVEFGIAVLDLNEEEWHKVTAIIKKD